jgi:L-alanine-DL-glutamate epimerase-like enolase superfamily enzyme
MIGRDPFALEYHHQVLTNAGGPFFIDIALWDIIGKACGQPLYELFGGHRTRVKAYAATCEVGTPERRAEDALRYLAEGFTALKLRRHNWSLDTEGYVHVTDKPGLGVELNEEIVERYRTSG